MGGSSNSFRRRDPDAAPRGTFSRNTRDGNPNGRVGKRRDSGEGLSSSDSDSPGSDNARRLNRSGTSGHRTYVPGSSYRGDRPDRGDRPYGERKFQGAGDNDSRRSGSSNGEGNSSENARQEETSPRWGSVTSRGAANLNREDSPNSSKITRIAPEEPHSAPEPMDVWVDETTADKKIAYSARSERTETGAKTSYNVDEILARESKGSVSQFRSSVVRRDLGDAIRAYQADRYKDAKRLLEGLLKYLDRSPSVMELLGLTHYRLGNWADAIPLLERSHEISRSVDQFPVLADCYRALGKHDKVNELYLEVGRISPSPEVMAEARIVLAGSMSDQEKYSEAISLLHRFENIARRKPRLVDIRQWYVLADLYEKTGELEHARTLFKKVAKEDVSLYDVAERLADLR